MASARQVWSASQASRLTTTAETLPFANVLLAHVGGAAALFLATTDATLLATIMPTIAEQLHVPPAQYTWVSVAYLLAQTMLQPVYGQLADKLGRKAILVASIVGFMIGSALTAFAPSTAVLILSRALSGAAAAGIVSSVWVILSEIVVPSKRAAWSMALSCTWCTSAVAGPVLGGVFARSGHSFLSWRVAFLVNVPICILALALVLVSLRRFKFPERRCYLTWTDMYRDIRAHFDFVGMFLLMGGTACVLLAFSRTAATGWNDRTSIALVVVGVACLVLAGLYEARTERDALIPPSLWQSMSASVVFISSFLITFAFNAGTFYLAVYAQARGASPLEAGYYLLPYSLGSSAISIPTAIFIDRAQRGTKKTTLPPKVAFTVGLGVAAVGFGLMTMLDVHSSAFERAFFPLVAGLGIGMTFHSPFQILTNAVGPEDLASTTGAFFLVRFIATTVGVSTGGVILTSVLQNDLPSNFTVDQVMSDLNGLVNIPDTTTRDAVLAVVTRALSIIWMVCCPMAGLACLAAICIPVTPVRSGEQVAKPKRAETPDSSHSTSPSATETVHTVDLEKGPLPDCLVVPPAPLATSSDELHPH
ncbi:MFS general substrate transporter [Exidia glandulosa HHB12029]|uniref:MFS general substrate transporter n=1 Tax=Exidia glandulosa HHB12029 TaxID=1314781 RepID=A0A165PFU4_EXIGL|nr:MFS general substrate transporter [Exidia glandulosa HHB12029]